MIYDALHKPIKFSQKRQLVWSIIAIASLVGLIFSYDYGQTALRYHNAVPGNFALTVILILVFFVSCAITSGYRAIIKYRRRQKLS